MDVLCVLHDSDEYGICRWPLVDLARAAGVPIKLLKELVAKDVLKGAEKGAKPYIYTPRHAGKDGDPVTLVEANEGPCWYCSRFVRDEWIRQRRGQSTQFSSDNQPPKNSPKTPPKGGIGERQGDGPTSTSSSSETTSVAKATGADAPSGIDPADAIFQIAVPWLVERGMQDKSARSLLGAARKELGDGGAWQLASECMREKPLEPAAWLAGALNTRIKAGKQSRHSGFDQTDYSEGVTADGRIA
jgi:hypothetical protein